MGARLNVAPTPLAGVCTVTTARHEDARGFFSRLFCADEMAQVLQGRTIVQVNQTLTRAVGTVRGLHYQRPPHAEMKLIRCLRGRVFDVAVDLRAGSASFGRWHAIELSAAGGEMIVIPEGCAHGFQVLESDTELLYLHTRAYAPDAEAGVHCEDPRLAIAWPLPVEGLSERDHALPRLASDFQGIRP